jgi:hypothetical protein
MSIFKRIRARFTTPDMPVFETYTLAEVCECGDPDCLIGILEGECCDRANRQREDHEALAAGAAVMGDMWAPVDVGRAYALNTNIGTPREWPVIDFTRSIPGRASHILPLDLEDLL